MEIKFNLSEYHRKEDDPLFKDGKLYSEYTEIDYVTPIPMDIEF